MRGFFIGLGFSLAFIIGALWARDVEPPAHAAAPSSGVESMCVSAEMAKVELKTADAGLTRKGGWNQALARYADSGWEPVQFIHDRETIAAVCFKRVARGGQLREVAPEPAPAPAPAPVVVAPPPPARAVEPEPKGRRGRGAATPEPVRVAEPEPAPAPEPAPEPEPEPARVEPPADTCASDCTRFGELAGATDMIRKVVADKCLVRCRAGDERYQACVRVARSSGDVQRCNAME
jgi:hypothetical protein